MNSVRAGSSPCSVSAMSAPSTLETKRACRPGRPKGDSARAAIAGPRSEPPMPMLTTLVIGWPRAPRTRPSRTSAAKASILSRSALIAGATSTPSTRIGAPERSRSALCSAARRSVELTSSPRNIASRLAATSAASASVEQQAQRLGVDPLLGEIVEQVAEDRMEAVEASRIGGEEIGNRAGRAARRAGRRARRRRSRASSRPWTFPFRRGALCVAPAPAAPSMLLCRPNCNCETSA